MVGVKSYMPGGGMMEQLMKLWCECEDAMTDHDNILWLWEARFKPQIQIQATVINDFYFPSAKHMNSDNWSVTLIPNSLLQKDKCTPNTPTFVCASSYPWAHCILEGVHFWIDRNLHLSHYRHFQSNNLIGYLIPCSGLAMLGGISNFLVHYIGDLSTLSLHVPCLSKH
jgi:hypothetical protein